MQSDSDDSAYLRATLAAAQAAATALAALEQTAERLAPTRLEQLADEVGRSCDTALQQARAALDLAPVPVEMQPLAEHFGAAFAAVEQAVELFRSAAQTFPPESIQRILGSWHQSARAQELFYSLRELLPPMRAYWDLPGCTIPAPVDPSANQRVGLTHVSRGGHHGGFSFYVPEYYTPEREWPVIVALHGGSGNGRDFVWTWLREARSLGYLLVSPSAVNDTWSDVEEVGLLEIMSWLGQRYRLDRDHILLTGLSDGATFALLYGLAHPDVFRALAPLCGVMHPANAMLGNLERAAGFPIYLVHGALDFIFPVMTARMAEETLRASGAALTYRELPELSHTYPRSENVPILRWFEALPPRLGV